MSVVNPALLQLTPRMSGCVCEPFGCVWTSAVPNRIRANSNSGPSDVIARVRRDTSWQHILDYASRPLKMKEEGLPSLTLLAASLSRTIFSKSTSDLFRGVPQMSLSRGVSIRRWQKLYMKHTIFMCASRIQRLIIRVSLLAKRHWHTSRAAIWHCQIWM